MVRSTFRCTSEIVQNLIDSSSPFPQKNGIHKTHLGNLCVYRVETYVKLTIFDI